MIHPWREGRSPKQLGKKGKSNHCWIVGIKLCLCWLINSRGEVVAWGWNTANVHDQAFLPMIRPFEGETITWQIGASPLLREFQRTSSQALSQGDLERAATG